MGEMQFRSLGHSGLMVSVVGVGCNAFGSRIDAEQVQRVVDAAFEQGVTLFDTADSYGDGASEELLGRALGSRREQIVLATKFGMGEHHAEHWGAHGSRRYVRRAVEASLRRLGTDYLDLYQLHRPDPVTPIEETLEAMSELVTEGKVRYIGSSNFSAWQVTEAEWTARAGGTRRFISAQNEYSLYNRLAERELVPACEAAGVGILPYFPLAYGLLTGKYRRGQAAPQGSRLALGSQASRLEGARWDRIEALRFFAENRGISMLTLAIGGLAAQPAVASVISGVTRPEQVETNARAGLWEPTAEDLRDLDELKERPEFSYTSFA
jgi:aryl-alcohol dehydrogenase-like predicted oxidoreductase